MVKLLGILALVLMLPQFGMAEPVARGPVTNYPMPRYVSIKGAEANMRRGPALTHRIDWVFRHRGTPLRVTAEYLAWRRVTDAEGASGWVHSVLLSNARTIVVIADRATLFEVADENSAAIAHAENGVIARLLSCLPTWCEVRVDGHQGWVSKAGIWGVDPDEVFD